MKAARAFPLILTLAVLVFVSCSDDSEPKQTVGPGDTGYKDLTQRDHVLFNLRKAYVERNIEEFDRLLDPDFVFYFSQADYKNGDVRVEQWDRAHELNATTNLFDPDFSSPYVRPVSKIDLTLTYSPGEDKWDEVLPEDQQKYPGETWYEKIVRYDLIVTAGFVNYTGLNIQASITVRLAEVGGKSIWRIILWYDDTENQLAALLAGMDAVDDATEESTWGKVKNLYAEQQ